MDTIYRLLPAMKITNMVWVAVLVSVLLMGEAFAQPLSHTNRKSIQALYSDGNSPTVDGRLTDPIWRDAEFKSDFLQKEPNLGQPPSNKMEVAIVYDDEAVYVGARMYADDPSKLRMYLDRRDTQGPAEQLIVSFDTYYDRRTAYTFGVNTAGVRFDRYHASDAEWDRDFSYNPVWEAKTALDSLGWTAEMRIPFSQLRFVNKDEQLWGVNFNRWIPSKNEDIFWVVVPREENGYSSWFGDLKGIREIQPSRRLEFLPYAAGDGSFTSLNEEGDPFHDGSDIDSRLGSDLKMGLGSNLTLEATFNPDFGQVEADPAEVNLSAFETFFSERRPFFLEGNDLFRTEASFFYSRRIGASPHGEAGGDFVDFPSNTSILAAAKLSGRLNSGLSIATLSAVTEREFATTIDTATNVRSEIEVEPLTFYNATRLRQEFGGDASTVGILMTTTQRDIDNFSPLRETLRKSAYTGSADWNLRFDGGKYDFIGMFGFSHIRGDTAVIRATQESSARYYQRPDADYVELEPNRTTMTGYRGIIRGGKRSGKHILFGGGASFESPDFEINDLGILGSADDIDSWAWVQYRETNPGKTFRKYSFEIFTNHGWDFGKVHQYSNIGTFISATWKNYWETWTMFKFDENGMNDSRTRGGPRMKMESGWTYNLGFSNPFSAATRFNGNLGYSVDYLDGWLYFASLRVSTRIGNRLELSVRPFYSREDQPRQYVTTLEDAAGGANTFGSRYVFSRIARNRISMQLRANYFFSPDLSLEVYAEPFAASGRYYGHGQLVEEGSDQITQIAPDGSQIVSNDDGTFSIVNNSDSTLNEDQSNFGFLSFRSNMVLRWEFSPGSSLYVVWQRNLSGQSEPGRNVRFRSLFDSIEGDGQDFLALKISYWIPAS